MEKKSIRLLAGIMFTDIVGYTALMQQDETRAITLRERHRRVLDKFITAHNGTILQYYGDGTLSIFGSAIEAVKCAAEIQKEFYNEPKIPLRLGIHLGDIVYDDEGVYGDGVNVTSRIESLSIPGAVLISDKIYDEIKNQTDIKAKSLGHYKLKNVQRHYEIYAIVDDKLSIPTPQQLRKLTEPSFKSIAVLPFVNMSPDPENEYFSDGISEEILNALTQVDGLQVTSRTSSFSFKGKNIDVRDIGKQLSVNTILEGSVRKAGNKVRITAQLINSSDGYHVWSESFDRDLENIFEVQDEIAKKISRTLREKLSPQEQRTSFVKTQTENMDAYNLYLKAKFHWNKWTPTDVSISLEYLKEALNLDPNWAQLYSALSGAYVYLGATGYLTPISAYPIAKSYAQKALELYPDDPESQLSMAMVKFFYDWEWDEAENYFHKALKLSPSSTSAHHYYSIYLSIMHRHDEAINHAKQAQNLDPLSPLMLSAVGDAYQHAGKFTDAIPFHEKALELDPEFRTSINSLGWSKWEIGEKDEALKLFENAKSLIGDASKGTTILGYIYAKLGKHDKAMECLKLLEQRAAKEKNAALESDFALLYLGLGDLDKVFEYLDAAFEKKAAVVLFIRSRHWAQIHDDPRYKKLMKRLKLN